MHSETRGIIQISTLLYCAPVVLLSQFCDILTPEVDVVHVTVGLLVLGDEPLHEVHGRHVLGGRCKLTRESSRDTNIMFNMHLIFNLLAYDHAMFSI